MDSEQLDHKAFVASLGDLERLSLTKKSDRAGLLYLLSHVACIVLTGVWIGLALPLWQGVLVLHGIQIVFLFTLLHETVHDTPFRSQHLNTWVGRICGFLIILQPTHFRYFHLAHHRHTHDPEKDPELASGSPTTLRNYLWYVSGIPVWWNHISTLLLCAAGKVYYPYVPKKAVPRIVREARIMIAFYRLLATVSLFSSSPILIYFWLLPILLGQPFLRIYLSAEHGRCPHVANMFENTRTTITNSVVRWLAWNMPYHAEHHAYPAVPFHKLPEFHEVAKRHLKITENGYTANSRKHVSELVRGNIG